MKLIEFQQQKEIPDYLKQKSGLTSQVIFTALFAWVFIIVYKPLGSNLWGDNTDAMKYFTWATAAVGAGFIVLAISRILMFYYGKVHRIFNWVYALWIFIEISVMAIMYTAIAKYFMPKTIWVWCQCILEGDKLMEFFWSTFFTIFFVLLIPTILCWLYLAFSQKKKDLLELQNQVKTAGGTPIIEQQSFLQFKDEKGEVKLHVKADCVIWIEASDNYVDITYKNQNKLVIFTLRNSLKRLAEDFKDTSLFRCHRSYMVNFDHAVALRKGADGLILEMDTQPAKEIPVSKTYKDETSQAFMQYHCRK